MSDIFISYASEDRPLVQRFAGALEERGWSVWWDRRIPVGRSFDEVIEEALDASRAVVVVWTSSSVKSQWVRNEAREGLRRRVLFPVMLQDEVKIPLEFRDVQAARLMGWEPEQEHQDFEQLVDDLTRTIGVPLTAGQDRLGSGAAPSIPGRSRLPARGDDNPAPPQAPARFQPFQTVLQQPYAHPSYPGLEIIVTLDTVVLVLPPPAVSMPIDLSRLPDNQWIQLRDPGERPLPVAVMRRGDFNMMRGYDVVAQWLP